ncbi:hypothetical protein N9D31_00800 [Oligoflexaceae bacterium]|nr:hypothetical protein [Oligoflexaceae bacterium]
MKQSFKISAFALLFSLAQGCVTSLESEVEINSRLEDDAEYFSVYDKYSQKMNVFSKFEMKYSMHATYLSDSFIAALSQRFQRLYKTNEPMLQEASSKTGFFVSVYSPEYGAMNISDGDLWKIFMSVDGDRVFPTAIKSVGVKERWQPFFAGVTHWSREFLVLFDTKMLDPNLDEMVQKTDTNLVFSHADASVTFKW